MTSTPHLSQMTPLFFILLYLPQRHSQSFTGPKIFAQKRPSLSGLKLRSLIVSGFLTSPYDHSLTFWEEASLSLGCSKLLESSKFFINHPAQLGKVYGY